MSGEQPDAAGALDTVPRLEHDAALIAAHQAGRQEALAEHADDVAATLATERTRVATILEAGAGRSHEAVTVAIAQGVSAEAASAMLRALPPAQVQGGMLGLDALMEGTNPRISADRPDRADMPTDQEHDADVTAGARRATEEMNR